MHKLDAVGIAFLGAYTVELLLRVWLRSWSRFWWVHDNVYEEMANRFDFGVTCAALLAFLVSRCVLRRGAAPGLARPHLRLAGAAFTAAPSRSWLAMTSRASC